MSWLFFIGPILLFIIVVRGMEVHEKARKDRVRLLEQALRSGDLDDETRRKLLDGINQTAWSRRRDGQRPTQPGSGWLSQICLLLGWLCLFGGLGLTAASAMFGMRFSVPALFFCFLGVGLITYPFAAADLDYRRARAAQSPSDAQRKPGS